MFISYFSASHCSFVAAVKSWTNLALVASLLSLATRHVASRNEIVALVFDGSD